MENDVLPNPWQWEDIPSHY